MRACSKIFLRKFTERYEQCYVSLMNDIPDVLTTIWCNQTYIYIYHSCNSDRW